MRRVAVVGAGAAGLAAARRLLREAEGHGFRLELRLLEASSRAGGCIVTARAEGFQMEEGPDAFLTTKPAGLALAESLGLAPRLMGTDPACRRSFVVRSGVLVPVPEGFYLLAPSSLAALIRTPLFSWRGKLRMALEPLVPVRRGAGAGDDETLASFVTRRLGREALDRFAQPMVGGITTADPATLSLAATFPQFLEIERVHGSVIRGLRHLPRGTSGPRYGLFASFRDGMQALVDALLGELPEDALALRTRLLALVPPSASTPWRLHCQDGKILEADAVCLALPAWASGPLLGQADPLLAAELSAIPYADCATLNLAFERDQITHPLDGMGFVVPAVEGLDLLSCSFSSVKFPGRAPEGKVLLRAFAGGAMQADRLEMDDATLTAAVLEDLRRLLGIRGEPLLTLLRRHVRAMPQYLLGHPSRVALIEAALDRHPTLALAGNWGRGAGVPDCIASGEAAADRLLEALA